MNNRTYSFFLILLLLHISVSGQILLKGKVLDEKKKTPVKDAYIILKNTKTNKISSYTVSDAQGEFAFEIDTVPMVFTLKVRHLSFDTWMRDLIVDELQDSSQVNVRVFLHKKEAELDEVVLHAKPPILIKKDTIIYDIKQFADHFDSDLENVLKKIKGIEISPDGEIKVEGRRVRKVLIDGKEIANAGAALITRSIDPSRVKSVEVRFDEKDTKIKESLLNSTDYVVLDIKLRKDFKQSLFGKARLTGGYREKTDLGFYTNAFSLNKHIKLHLFAEHDAFGRQTISLIKIKNIGQEALAQLFKRPADFSELTAREAFDDEIYDLKKYSQWRRSVLGLTGRVDISEKWSLFLGSYSSKEDLQRIEESLQVFVAGNTFSTLSKNRNFSVDSKNKVELRYDTKNTKLRLDLNYVYEKPDKSQFYLDRDTILYNFDEFNLKNSWYANFFAEHLINEKTGIEAKASYSLISLDNTNLYEHENEEAANELKDINALPTYQFQQNSNTVLNDIFFKTGINRFTKFGTLVYTFQGKFRKMAYAQSGINLESGNPVAGFSQDETHYFYNDLLLSVNHTVELGNFTLNNKLGLMYAVLPQTFSENNKKSGINIDLGVTYSPEIHSTYNLNYRNVYSSYPLLKHILVKKILDFQNIQYPASNINLVREQIVEGSVYKNFSVFELTAAYLNGKSNTSNRYLVTNSFFVNKELDQFASMYHVVSFKLKSKIPETPLELVLEPEGIWYKNKNISNFQTYFTHTRWLLLGFKMNTTSSIRGIDFKIYPKYTHIDYSNDLSNSATFQSMLSVKSEVSYEILKKYLQIGLNYRFVRFGGISDSTLHLADLNARGVFGKWRWNFEFSNIFNAKSFDTQMNSPVFFLNRSNYIFGRYVKLGLEFRFDL